MGASGSTYYSEDIETNVPIGTYLVLYHLESSVSQSEPYIIQGGVGSRGGFTETMALAVRATMQNGGGCTGYCIFTATSATNKLRLGAYATVSNYTITGVVTLIKLI